MNQKWISAYRDAMSFRASHYFVSFMSEASAVAAGFGYTPPDVTSARLDQNQLWIFIQANCFQKQHFHEAETHIFCHLSGLF